MSEEWRPIPGFTRYEASNIGRIRSLFWKPPRVLSPENDKDGYPRLTLFPPSGKCHRPVHALVCAAFHGPRPDGMVVRHLDGAKMNNRPENLRWGTVAENNRDMERHGRRARGARITRSVLTETSAREILRRYSEGERQCDLARAFGVSHNTVHSLVKRRSWRWLDEPLLAELP